MFKTWLPARFWVAGWVLLLLSVLHALAPSFTIERFNTVLPDGSIVQGPGTRHYFVHQQKYIPVTQADADQWFVREKDGTPLQLDRESIPVPTLDAASVDTSSSLGGLLTGKDPNVVYAQEGAVRVLPQRPHDQPETTVGAVQVQQETPLPIMPVVEKATAPILTTPTTVETWVPYAPF